LRNHFRSEYRKRRREVEDSDGHHAESLKSQPDQYGHVEFREFREALAQLPSDQREALILVGASGFSYEEAAGICGCAVGTIKSRVNRARTRLAELLHVNSAEDFGPDETTRAVLASGGESHCLLVHSHSATLIRPNSGRPRTTEVVQGLPDTHYADERYGTVGRPRTRPAITEIAN